MLKTLKRRLTHLTAGPSGGFGAEEDTYESRRAASVAFAFGLPPSVILLGVVFSIVLAVPYYASVEGMFDFAKHTVGRDFVNLWTAGALIDQERALDIFDPQLFGAAQRELIDPDFPLHFWSYPPTALFLAAPLSALPYVLAYILWTGVTLAALVVAAWRLLQNWSAVLVLVVAPSTIINLMLGQNGYLTAALMVGGFTLLLQQRPVLAGVLFGLLTFKPHLGLMIPIALLALGQWRAIFAAATTGLALAAASVAAFGWDSWLAFVDRTLPFQLSFMSDGTGPFTWMMPTLFMSGRLIGLSADAAYALQTILGATVAVAVFLAFRRGGNWRLLFAIAFVAPIVASPQAFNYDMGLVSVAVLLLASATSSGQFGMIERRIIELAWCMPILVMVFNAAGVPIAPLVLAAFLVYLLVRLRHRAPANSGIADDPVSPARLSIG